MIPINHRNKLQESLKSFNYCYLFTIIETHSNHSFKKIRIIEHALAHRLPPVTSPNKFQFSIVFLDNNRCIFDYLVHSILAQNNISSNYHI